MIRDSIYNLLDLYLKRPPTSVVNYKRELEIISCFQNGCDKLTLPNYLQRLLYFFHKHKESIDTIILWGSCVSGGETSSSFSFLRNEKHNFSRCVIGNSDVDALIILKKPLQIPQEFYQYLELSIDTGDPVGIVNLDVYRDVICINLDEVDLEFHKRKDTYLSYYIHSYIKMGIVLKISSRIECLLKDFSTDNDVVKIADIDGAFKRKKLQLIKERL